MVPCRIIASLVMCLWIQSWVHTWIQSLKNYQWQKVHEILAPVLVIISGKSLVFSRVRKKSLALVQALFRTGANPFSHRCKPFFAPVQPFFAPVQGLFPDSCPGGSEEFLNHFLATLPVLAERLPLPGRQDHKFRRPIWPGCSKSPQKVSNGSAGPRGSAGQSLSEGWRMSQEVSRSHFSGHS